MSTGGLYHRDERESKKLSRGSRINLNSFLFIPVVEQNIWRPDLISSETKVLDPRVLCLVPLQIVVVPLLGSRSTTLDLHKNLKRETELLHR